MGGTPSTSISKPTVMEHGKCVLQLCYSTSSTEIQAVPEVSCVQASLLLQSAPDFLVQKYSQTPSIFT